MEQECSANMPVAWSAAMFTILYNTIMIIEGVNFTLRTDLGDLDFLGHVSGLGAFPRVLARLSAEVISQPSRPSRDVCPSELLNFARGSLGRREMQGLSGLVSGPR